jgi:hypothetical protein
VTNIINILNKFGIIFEDINFINKICLKALRTNNALSHLFYTNIKTTTQNKRIFEKTIGETFRFVAQDMHSDICPHFELSMLPIQTSGFHYELLLKKTLWVGNYATLKSLINGVDGNFHYHIVQFVQNH